MQQCFIERVYVFHISEYSSYDLLFVYQFGTVDFSLGRDGEGWGGERTGSVHQEAEFWVYSDSQSIFFFLSSHNNLPTSIKSWESDVLEFFTGQQVVVFNNLKSIECGVVLVLYAWQFLYHLVWNYLEIVLRYTASGKLSQISQLQLK